MATIPSVISALVSVSVSHLGLPVIIVNFVTLLAMEMLIIFVSVSQRGTCIGRILL